VIYHFSIAEPLLRSAGNDDAAAVAQARLEECR
jgi:hypothetical protein